MDAGRRKNGTDFAFLGQKKCFIFDMDGTVCLGSRPFPAAVALIRALRTAGRQVVFFTNNANRSHEDMMNALGKMGFEPRPFEMMTAGDATVEFLHRERAGKRVYLLGIPAQAARFQEAGICLVKEGEPADVVVSSFDMTLTYDRVRNACRLIRGGAEYLCTHPDFNFPTETGFIPDSGAVAAMITASTGVTPQFFGKPYPQGMVLMQKKYGFTADETVMVGDRLYTDIAFGKANGVTAVLVLTGETKPADLETAPAEWQPDVILPDLAPLLPLFG